MHTTFPAFSDNENQKATVWLLWSMCALRREGIRTISSVRMSLVRELKSLRNGGVERLQAPCPEGPALRALSLRGVSADVSALTDIRGRGEDKNRAKPNFGIWAKSDYKSFGLGGWEVSFSSQLFVDTRILGCTFWPQSPRALAAMGMMKTVPVETWDSLDIARLFPEDEQREGIWGSTGEPPALQPLWQRGTPGRHGDPPLSPPPLPLQAVTGKGDLLPVAQLSRPWNGEEVAVMVHRGLLKYFLEIG